jgi:hypothetical protein
VHRRRDHGGVLFIDLRDHYGITQVLCDPDSPVFAEVEKLRAEYCIRIDGEVKARDPELVNPSCPPARSRSSSATWRSWAASTASCRCRSSAIRNTPRRRACATATSTCGARRCRPT